MKKINILFLVSNFDIGGVETANVKMINGINKDKFNVHVLYIKKGVLMDELIESNIKILKIGNRLSLKSFSNLYYVLKIYRYVKLNKIDIVHTIDPVFYIIGSVASRLAEIKHIRTQPNFIRRHEKLNTKTLRILPFEKWTDKYITYNNASRMDLQFAGVNEQKIVTIYGYSKHKDFLFYNDFQDIRDEFGIPEENKIILAMHRMVPKKGFEIFIKMIPYIIKDYRKVTFLLVGDGPLKKELENLVRKLKIQEFVVFTGFRKDIVNITKQISFGIYPLADTAGMGTVIRSGKVLISKENSAMDEYIEHGYTGFLSPDDVPESYAKYALTLLKNDKLLKSMEKKQREFIKSKFDGNKNMEKFEDLITSLIK